MFVREREADTLHHVGSVSASTAQIAYEETTKLFAWYAKDICRGASRLRTLTVHDDPFAPDPQISPKTESRHQYRLECRLMPSPEP
ncbi:hypothetical protein [Halomarina pelagica]|uniref:hypothetical protein n=1 Tax=Halomarina pelagica TaxID=2961599 RepID=UPI002113D682|nr:hypothetical protein [Halomarina sp. BND7]